MLISLAVPAVGPMSQNRHRSGSIVDRPSIPRDTNGSGKSFTNAVSARPLGGPGAAIAPPRSGAVSAMSRTVASKTPSIFSGYVDSRFWQFKHGLGGAIAALAATW